MTFDMHNIHTIFESAEDKVDTTAAHDETGANLDNTLRDNDLLAIFDDICPITGDVYASMKNAASDPKNLKITVTKNGDGEDAKLFIEAVEFMTFCEAGEYNIGEAAEEIIDAYKEEIPALDNAEFHVVFPSDSLNKDTLGGETRGLAVDNDWPMQLMRGCRRYGIHVNQGVEGVNESTALQRHIDNKQSNGGWKDILDKVDRSSQKDAESRIAKDKTRYWSKNYPDDVTEKEEDDQAEILIKHAKSLKSDINSRHGVEGVNK